MAQEYTRFVEIKMYSPTFTSVVSAWLASYMVDYIANATSMWASPRHPLTGGALLFERATQTPAIEEQASPSDGKNYY